MLRNLSLWPMKIGIFAAPFALISSGNTRTLSYAKTIYYGKALSNLPGIARGLVQEVLGRGIA